MKLGAVTVSGGGAVTALAATGWGLAAVLGMIFILCLLVLCSRKVNDLFCRSVAALKARPGNPLVVEHDRAVKATEVGNVLEAPELVRLRQVQDVPDVRPPSS